MVLVTAGGSGMGPAAVLAFAHEGARVMLADVDADWGFLKNKIRDTLSEFFYERLKRRPMILPLVVEV